MLIRTAEAAILPADTVAPDYSQAVNYCLFHQYDRAEPALLAILRQASHPNRDAAIRLLTEEVYLYRGQYNQYVALADSINYKGDKYAFARLMSSQPPTRITLTDSMTQPFQLKNRGHIVVTLFVNGRPKRFMVDTGAQRTMISNRLATELNLRELTDVEVTNSLGQTLPSSIRMLDSLRFGALHVSHLPVMTQSLSGVSADGLLGWDVLRHLELMIDYASRTLTLCQPLAQPRSTVKNLLGGSRPMIVAQTGSTNYLTLLLDTGSDGLVELTPAGRAKLIDGRLGHRLCVQFGIGGRMRMRRQKVVKGATIQIAGTTRQLRKMITDRSNEMAESVLVDGVVGSGFFRTGRLVLDPANDCFQFIIVESK